MNVGYDVRMIESSGIGTTISGLLNHLSQDQLKQMTLFSKPNWANPYPSAQVQVPYPIYSLRAHLGYPGLIKKEELDFFHMPHFDVPLGYKGPFIATVHDLIHILFPQFSNKPFSRFYAKLLLRHVVKHAKKIIVVSENTKQDLLQFFPQAQNKVKVIYSGIGQKFSKASSSDIEDVLAAYKLKPGYVLYVGNLRGSKNSKGLLKAYEKARQADKTIPALVLAGKSSLGAGVAIPEGVKTIGEVTSRQLPALYSAAKMFVFPSFYEGFGLPPLEAMACDVPVIASRVASLPEACGAAALYVDPYSIDSMAEAIVKLNKDENQQNKLRAAGRENIKRFSWKRCAEQTWTVYEEVMKDR